MSAKLIIRPGENKTFYSGEILRKMRNADFLTNSLSAGSTNRLSSYRKSLVRSQGVGSPLFDSKVYSLLKGYVWDEGALDSNVDYLNNLVDKEGYSFSRNLKLYDHTQEAMERFIAPDHPSFRWNENYQQSLKWLKNLFSKTKLIPQRYESDDDIRAALPKINTHSGYTYIISGLKKKGDNIDGLYNKLKHRKNSIRKGIAVESTPVLVAFRTQASGEFEDDGSRTNTCKHKTRIVSMYDLLNVVLELQFSNPIQQYMNSLDQYAGGKDEGQIGAIIHNYAHKHKKFMSIDYSSFDQTISSWLIEDAFDVLACAFPRMTDGQRKEFNQIVNNFIHKDFILAEGVLHSDKGVPSGSMFTQIIDTVVNWIVILTYFNSKSQTCDMIAMGDDNAIFCDEKESIKDLATYVSKNFGLIVKVDDKSNEGLTVESDVKFLSRYWSPGGPWKHPNQLVSRLLFPERFRDYTHEVQPQHVIFAYILTYERGMSQLMNVSQFLRDYPIGALNVFKNVDSRYVPGSLAYIREYTNHGVA